MEQIEFSLKNFFSSAETELKIESGEKGVFSASDKKHIQNIVAEETSKTKQRLAIAYKEENQKEVLVVTKK